MDWGLVSYSGALEKQKELQTALVEQKLIKRRLEIDSSENSYPSSVDLQSNLTASSYLIFCEHPPVFTLGNRASPKNLLITKDELEKRNIEVFPIKRGGDITFHGPGQLVVYPILDLELFFTDIHKYLRYLEEAVIQTLALFGIEGGRIEGLSGVWIQPDNPKKARKICAVGIHCSRWVTMHGLALNVNTDLDYFSDIIPCGIKDKEVTSMAKELSELVEFEKVKWVLKEKIAQQFGMYFLGAGE